MIQQSVLPNGIRIVTESHKHTDTVSIGVWVGIGARYEKEEENGISHCLEHMAFKGTKTRSAMQIAQEIEDVGGLMNAYTGKDVTAYYMKILKDDQTLALQILADILQESQMDNAELSKEKGVIIQEINMQNDTPDELVFDCFAETAFPKQALGRTILGTAKSVQAITSAQLLQYMHRRYTTDRMVISVSGAISHEAFVEKCSRLFTRIETRADTGYDPAFYQGGEYRRIKQNEQINLVLGFEGVSYQNPDYYGTNVLSTILGNGMSSRLFQEIREKRGLVYSIYAHNSPELDTGSFCIYAGTGEKEVKELIPVLCDSILNLPDTITDDELKRAKAQIKARILMRLENPATHAEANALDLVIRGRLISKEEAIAQVEKITREDLSRIGHRIFSGRPTLAALGPIQDVMSYDKICERLVF